MSRRCFQCKQILPKKDVASITHKVMRYCIPVAVLSGADEILDAVEEACEFEAAAVVDDALELDVVATTEIKVSPTADDVPGTHWSRNGHIVSTVSRIQCLSWSLAVIEVLCCTNSARCTDSGAGIPSTSTLAINWHIRPCEGGQQGGQPCRLDCHSSQSHRFGEGRESKICEDNG